ncbi:MAG: DNA polymerase III subunit alpha [Chloroflexota bacterium]
MSFVHLHTLSWYSLLEGLDSPAALAQAAAKAGMPALALTDHNRLSGAIEFYDACLAAGVQPVIGLQLDHRPPPELAAAVQLPAGRLTLLAESAAGWGTLCRLSSAAFAGGVEAQPVAFETLAAQHSGLLCLSGGRGGLAAALLDAGQPAAARRWLELLGELFPGRLYAELQRHSPDDRGWVEALAGLSRKLRLPLAATHAVHYLKPEQAGLQRTAAAIRTVQPRAGLDPQQAAPPEAYFLDQAEMQRRFADHPQALAAGGEIAGRCQCELPLGRPHFPQVELPAGQSAIQALRRRAGDGLQRRYLQRTPPLSDAEIEAVRRRLEHELQVIGDFGYEALFLVMQEIIAFAHRQGIPTASRGSASSSLVAHCLDITTPDPVQLNLYFERFLNPARSKPPDIDTDLCSRRRDQVIDFVYRRFGAERVAMVCTVNRFRRRSALRDVAKAYGLAPAQVNQLVEGLPHRWYGPPWRGEDDQDPFAALREQFHAPQHLAIFQDAQALRGAPRHLGIHPGGIVIAPGPLVDFTPTQLATKGILTTQLDLDAIERLGLVKLDLLGIRGLTVLGDAASGLQERRQAGETGGAGTEAAGEAPGQPGSALLVLDAIPATDPAISDMVEHGRTIGCFQIESPGMRATLREIHARTTDDILAALALYRPGPLTGGLKDAFVARYRGLEQPRYPHPALQTVLGDTYGVILYQEQVLRIAHEIAGMSLADSDLLRRAMSHFDPGKQMQTLKERFMAGALERSRIPPAVSEQIWEQMAAFAGYGFPKAHAASYARVAWQSAWCKVHVPELFMAAVLANWGGYYGQRVYLSEARRMGLALRPPHINFATPEFSANQVNGRACLFMGLNQVRELTQRTQQRILRGRPFHSLADFLARADPRRQEAENLVRAGALEGLGSIPDLLAQIEAGGWRSGQLPLFAQAGGRPDWTLEQKVAAQEQVLGAGIAAHPLELHAARLAAAGALTTVEAAARIGQAVRVAGVRQTWRRSRAARGEYIYFMSLEDLEGMLEIIIPAGVYRQGRNALDGPGPYLIEGTVEWDAERGEPLVRAEKVWA